MAGTHFEHGKPGALEATYPGMVGAALIEITLFLKGNSYEDSKGKRTI